MLTEVLRSGEWVEGRAVSTEVRHPAAVAIAQAVRDLDGLRRTAVLLRNAGGAELVIAADTRERCLVYARTRDGEYQAPVGDPSLDGETARVRLFGDPVDFPIKRMIPLELAIEVALRFGFDGSLEPGLSWEAAPRGIGPAVIRPEPPG